MTRLRDAALVDVDIELTNGMSLGMRSIVTDVNLWII